jgi:ABC-type Mn2+/Zn2+ transport system permease subunit
MFRYGPAVVHTAVGGVVLGFLASQPDCSADECLRTLFLGASVVGWIVTAISVVVLERGPTGSRIVSWILPFLWPPVAWAAALSLFLWFPSLGSA